MSHDDAPLDLTNAVEIIAARLLQAGAHHLVAAALAIAARGQHGTNVEAFADAQNLDLAEVHAIEAGDVALEELPRQISDVLDANGLVDLPALADLDAQIRDAAAKRDAAP